MHSVYSLITQKPSNQPSTDNIPHKLLLPICAGIVFSALSIPASADSRFTYTAGDIQYPTDQRFTAGTNQGEYRYFIHDLNGDGATDIIMTGLTRPGQHGRRGQQFGLILLNNGDNTFRVAEGDVPGSEEAREVLVADFNGDNISDFYIADHGYDTDPFPGFKNQLLLGTGNGFTDVSNRLPDIEAFSHNGAVGDIDGDGDIDILSLNTDHIPVEEISYFLINDGDANFTQNRTRLPNTLTNSDLGIIRTSFAAELSDLDGDGFPELIIGRNDTATRIYWNDGAGFFTDSAVTFLADADVFGGLEKIAVIDIRGVDFNGDGLNDLLLNAYNQFAYDQGISMQLFINQGNREFKDETLTRLTSLVRSSDPTLQTPTFNQFIDVNGDGITDILPVGLGGVNSSDNSVVLFEGDKEGCFNPITMKSVSEDPEQTYVLGLRLLMVSSDAIGFVEINYETTDNVDTIIIRKYIPLIIQPVPPVANRFHACRSKIEVSVDLVEDGMFTLDFSIHATEPDVVIKAETSSLKDLIEAIEKMATFTDDILTLPELVIDGVVAYRNLIFELTDAKELLFTLISLE